MIFGLKNIPIALHVLANDDKTTLSPWWGRKWCRKRGLTTTQSLRSWFDAQPAYCLDANRSSEALAKKLAKGIEVKPGELVIPFTR